MRRSSCLPSDSTARPPPLSTVSSTPKITPSTWSSVCRPNSARVSDYINTCNSVCDDYLNSLDYHYMFQCSPAAALFLFHPCFSPSLVTIRYQKTDGRFGTTSFNHASLADGQDHHVMLHASGLQGGPPRLHIYVDCRLVHTLEDLPAAFGSLPQGPNKVALRTLQSTGQVIKKFTVQTLQRNYEHCLSGAIP